VLRRVSMHASASAFAFRRQCQNSTLAILTLTMCVSTHATASPSSSSIAPLAPRLEDSIRLHDAFRAQRARDKANETREPRQLRVAMVTETSNADACVEARLWSQHKVAHMHILNKQSFFRLLSCSAQISAQPT